MTWLPLVVVALMVLLLFVQALHLVKKPMVPAGPPESMLVEQELFDEVDHTGVVVDEQEDFEIETERRVNSLPESEVSGTQEVKGPPLVVENPVISDGFEWVEWPESSGQNYFREVGTTDEWKTWPVE